MPRTDADSGTTSTSQGHINKDGHQIRGNAPEKIKALASSIFFHFVDAKGKSYGSDVGKKLKINEINIHGFEPAVLSDKQARDRVDKDEGNTLSVDTVFELVVSREMCNLHGTLHGACAAYLIDPCSNAPLVVLGLLLGVDGSGMSQSMNLIWHYPVYEGTKISIKATSMYITGRIRTARCEIWAGNRLCVSAVHSTINPTVKANKSKL